MNKEDLLENFIKSLFPKFQNYLNSNFSIVNFRLWSNLPNTKATMGRKGKERGTLRVHTDGFPKGHIKCMVYLQPLNEDYGKFEIENKILQHEKPGLGIIFNNNLSLHKAIPGTKYPRDVVELTLMRTLIKVDELKYCFPSKPDSLYLNGPHSAYL